MNRVLLSLLVACCACSKRDVRPAECDDVVLGVCVKSRGERYDSRYVERQIQLSLAYWNEPDTALAGWAIVFRHDQVPCPRALGSGCTWWDRNRTIELQVLDPRCPETAQLVHEIGHVLHHDGGHVGKWWSWQREQAATWGIVRSPGASPGCAGSRYYVREPVEHPS